MIYFVQDSRDQRIKIGFSLDPWQRMKELAVAAPDSLKLLAVMDGNKDTESGLHSLFKHIRDAGEWFRPEADLLRFIEGIKPHHSQERRSRRSSTEWERSAATFRPTSQQLLEMEMDFQRKKRKQAGLPPENHPAELLGDFHVGGEVAHMCDRLQFLVLIVDCRNRAAIPTEASLVDVAKLLEDHARLFAEVATLQQRFPELARPQAQRDPAAHPSEAEMKEAAE